MKNSETKIKLTNPQWCTLCEIAGAPRNMWENYPPLKKLLSLGFVEAKNHGMYFATEAGLKHLEVTK